MGFLNNAKIEYFYICPPFFWWDATGIKLKKKVTDGTTITTTEYMDGYQYINNSLDFFPHAEGYVKGLNGHIGTNYKYIFNYTDPLGNIRLKYSENTSTNEITILEENHYYPYGLTHKGYNGNHKVFTEDAGGNITLTPVTPILNDSYKYGYNGKELSEDLGLNFYEMDVRQYDPALARWIAMDPVVHHSQSPYNSFDSNPIFWADPSGADATFTGLAAQNVFRDLLSDISSKPKKEKESRDENDDWIKKRGENAYVYDEDVSNPDDKDLPEDFEYVGKDLNAVYQNHNNNLSFIERVKKSMGIGSGPSINYGSYLSAMLNPIIGKGFLSQRNAAKRFIQNLSNDYFFDGIDTNLDPLLPKGPYSFTSTLCIDGKTISASIEYINRSSDVNFINQITAEGTYTTTFSQIIYSNTFHLSRGTVNNNIKVYNLSNQDYNFLSNFIWNRN
jgi:RHS repeat-associated protein